jgi:hypothetical protein
MGWQGLSPPQSLSQRLWRRQRRRRRRLWWLRLRRRRQGQIV